MRPNSVSALPAARSRTRAGGPRRFFAQGIRRYGFHGLSQEWIARRMADLGPRLAAGRVIAAHLGNGANLCAAHRPKH